MNQTYSSIKDGKYQLPRQAYNPVSTERMYTTKKPPVQTRDSYSIERAYTTKLPSNINIFSKLSEKIGSFSDQNVKKQTMTILAALNHTLQQIAMDNNLSNHLSRLSVIEQEDSTVLIEWNFQSFRVGFSVEPEESESNYYLASEDEKTGNFSMNAKKIGADIDKIVTNMIEYVIVNT